MSEMNIYKKLNVARSKLHSMKLKKSGYNNFSKYAYFELGDFLEPALEIFSEVGLCGTVNFREMTATLTIRNVDNFHEAIEFSCPIVIPTMKGTNEIQALGSAQTYLRRYLWVAALEIVENDVVDAVSGKDKTPAQKIADANVTPTGGVWESLTEENRMLVQGMADEIDAAFNPYFPGKAYDLYERHKATLEEADLQVALRSRLDSKVRTALKKVHDERVSHVKQT